MIHPTDRATTSPSLAPYFQLLWSTDLVAAQTMPAKITAEGNDRTNLFPQYLFYGAHAQTHKKKFRY
jgi:hypothetical protein